MMQTSYLCLFTHFDFRQLEKDKKLELNENEFILEIQIKLLKKFHN